jgi:hypothetical protein
MAALSPTGSAIPIERYRRLPLASASISWLSPASIGATKVSVSTTSAKESAMNIAHLS